jgi:hypothetical protein
VKQVNPAREQVRRPSAQASGGASRERERELARVAIQEELDLVHELWDALDLVDEDVSASPSDRQEGTRQSARILRKPETFRTILQVDEEVVRRGEAAEQRRLADLSRTEDEASLAEGGPPAQGRLEEPDMLHHPAYFTPNSAARCSFPSTGRRASRLRLVATITQAEVVVAILHCIGLPTRTPPLAPAREPPQRELWPQ